MSRPDIEGIRARHAKLATNCHSEQFIIGWAFEVVPALLDYVEELERHNKSLRELVGGEVLHSTAETDFLRREYDNQ